MRQGKHRGHWVIEPRDVGTAHLLAGEEYILQVTDVGSTYCVDDKGDRIIETVEVEVKHAHTDRDF